MASGTRLKVQQVLGKGSRDPEEGHPRMLVLEVDLILGFEGRGQQGLAGLRRGELRRHSGRGH